MYFFNISRSAHQSLTDAFDFAGPAQGGLWNLRWQVIGYRQVSPDASEDELYRRFFEGTPVNYRNLRGWSSRPWEQVEQNLARFLLTNLIATYEAWVVGILRAVDMYSEDNAKGLQFPDAKSKGYSWVLSRAKPSAVMCDCFRVPLARSRRFSDRKRLNNLLICYRAFKELRNAVVHEGSIATQRTIAANLELDRLSASDLGVGEVPKTTVATLGNPVKLVLRGVVGLCGILLRIVTTLDCELSGTKGGESSFLSVWKASYTGETKLPDAKVSRHHKISTMVHELKIPRPENHAELCKFLKCHGLVSYS